MFTVLKSWSIPFKYRLLIYAPGSILLLCFNALLPLQDNKSIEQEKQTLLTAKHQGDIDNTLEHLQQALAFDQEVGYKHGAAVTLAKIGLVYKQQGDFGNALKYHQQALDVHKGTGNERRQATTLGNIGFIYQEKGDFHNALKYLKQAKKQFESLGEMPAAEVASKAIVKIERSQ